MVPNSKILNVTVNSYLKWILLMKFFFQIAKETFIGSNMVQKSKVLSPTRKGLMNKCSIFREQWTYSIQ